MNQGETKMLNDQPQGEGKDYAVECDGCMRAFKLKNLKEWGDGRIFCRSCYDVMDEERNA